jgi:hypothetical protein
MSVSNPGVVAPNTSSRAAPITRPAKPTMTGKGIESWIRALLPKLGNVTHRWSGQVLDPIDYAAFIGLNPATNMFSFTPTIPDKELLTALPEAFCCRASLPARNARGRNSTIHPA